MIERIDDMPEGTIGLRAAGRLSVDDYREVLEPTLRGAVESGELRLMFTLTDFDGLEPGAWMTPGEVAVYDLGQEAEARDWVAA